MLKNILYGSLQNLRDPKFWSQRWRSVKKCKFISTLKLNHDSIINKETRPVRSKYAESNTKLQIEGKSVIVIVDDGWMTAKTGLSDRLKGINFVYSCVKDLNTEGLDIKFKIHFVTPFELSNYLEPNLYDWRIDAGDISYNSTQAEPLQISSHYGSRRLESKLRMDKLKQIIKSSNSSQIHVSTNMLDYDKGRYTQCFNELFKPTLIVQKEMDYYLEKLNGGSYISATFRFMNLLGDFKEGNRRSMNSSDDRERLLSSCIAQVQKLHIKYPNKRILVTADSRTFLDRVVFLPYVFTIDGALVHMAFTDDNSLDLHKKSFVDYLMIAQADEVYLLRTGRMYKSGFPETSSLIHNKPFKYIEF